MFEVEQYIVSKGIQFRKEYNTSKNSRELICQCFFCDKPDKMYINSQSGMYHCFSCDTKGNMISLKKHFGDLMEVREEKRRLILPSIVKEQDFNSFHESLISSPDANYARMYLLEKRGITDETIKKYKLGFKKEIPIAKDLQQPKGGWILFPYLYDKGKNCTYIKARNIDKGYQYKYKHFKKGNDFPLYAPNGINIDEPLIITSGELDCLSLIQLGFENVVSFSTGEKSLSPMYLRQLADAKDIIVLFDNDSAGEMGAEKAINALGGYRTKKATLPEWFNDINCKDINDYLVNGAKKQDLELIINKAEYVLGSSVRHISYFTNNLVDRYKNKDKMLGESTGWKELDMLIKGLRKGELIVVTSESGSGKTTFVSNLALNLMERGKPVFFWSAEVKTENQIDIFVRQMGKNDPWELSDQELMLIQEKLNSFQLFDFSGYDGFNLQMIENSLEYAIRTLGIEYVFVDHLHYIIDEGAKNEREQISSVMKLFEKLAIKHNVCFVVVAHPKSSNTTNGENYIVQMGALKGTSSIKQLASVIISLYRPRKEDRSDILDENGKGVTIGYVLKCRKHVGMEGSFTLSYDIKSATYEDDFRTEEDYKKANVYDSIQEKRITAQELFKKHWTQEEGEEEL